MRQLLDNFLMKTEARGTSTEIILRCTSVFLETSDGAITTAMAHYSTSPAFSTSNDQFWSVQRGGD
jgi:hypothetical protein